MNPDTKLVLDEIAKLSKRFDEIDSQFVDHESKIDARLQERDTEWERKLVDLRGAHDARVSALEQAAGSFDEWRPDIEGMVDDIRLELGKLNKHWGRALLDRPPPLLQQTPQAAERSPPLGGAFSPSGHCVDSNTRADGFGSVTTLLHPRPRVRPVSPTSFLVP